MSDAKERLKKDIEKLKQILDEGAWDESKESSITLGETKGKPYKIILKGISDSIIAIKADKFPTGEGFFVSKNGENWIRKHADYILITVHKEKKAAIIVELKSGDNKRNNELFSQLKGGLAAFWHCRTIGKLFLKENDRQVEDFLDDYLFAFVKIKVTRKEKMEREGSPPASLKDDVLGEIKYLPCIEDDELPIASLLGKCFPLPESERLNFF